MVLSVSKSWFTGLWIASGILPLMIWLTLISGLSMVSPRKNCCAASWTVSTKAGCEMVTSLSLENTGTTQSLCRWRSETSLVLASIKGVVLSVLSGCVMVIGCCVGRGMISCLTGWSWSAVSIVLRGLGLNNV